MDPRLARAAAKLERRLFIAGKALAPRHPVPSATVFVSGVQRSGTNMIMDVVESSRDADVIQETDARLYLGYRLRGDDAVAAARRITRRPLLVIKALMEADRLSALMDAFAPARAIWVVRAPGDVINSNMKSWPGGRNRLDEIITDPVRGGWRSAGMREETLAELRAAYRPGLDDANAQALFYWYRSRLALDQQLDRDPRARIVDYDRFVRAPAPELAALADWLGIAVTPRMAAIPHAGSIRKSAPPPLAPHIAALCEDVHTRLTAR